MDFGCGTGSSSRLFFDILGIEYFVGMDESENSLEIARRKHGSKRAQFLLFDEYQPCGQFDLVFCNGVFHHIPPLDRAARDRLHFTITAAGWIVRVLGKQSLESRHSLCNEPNSLRSRCHHSFRSRSTSSITSWRVRDSPNRFSVYLSENSPLVPLESNRYVHDFPSARNIKFFAVNLHSWRQLQQGTFFHGYKITPPSRLEKV